MAKKELVKCEKPPSKYDQIFFLWCFNHKIYGIIAAHVDPINLFLPNSKSQHCYCSVVHSIKFYKRMRKRETKDEFFNFLYILVNAFY